MNDKINQSKNEYMRVYMQEYRKKNREKLNAQRRDWAKNNPDKIKKYQERYWQKKLDL